MLKDFFRKPRAKSWKNATGEKVMSKKKWALGGGAIAALIALGAILMWAGSATVHMTNSVEFCISCHEMKENNFSEYSETIHAKNRTGVQAVCSDCHVPHDSIGLIKRKIFAVTDVWHHLLGTIDTKEKFENHRAELASRVWKHMKETDSQECRQCHQASAMDQSLQGPTAIKQHKRMVTENKTCIDCHYGIAHHEPVGIEPADVIEVK
jgi:cytochrome c-type protein NapC